MDKYSLVDMLVGQVVLEQPEGPRSIQFEGIQIPMIQRDYAQGRPEESEVRNRFLTAIFTALVEGEILELDFVYGSVQLLDNKAYFIPLDGQQRLTTLFLLYWYLGKRELPAEKWDEVRARIGRFTYATRSSARDFCEKLMTAAWSPPASPREALGGAAWFYLRHQQDPTVRAMLEMLEAIHGRYEQIRSALGPNGLFPGLAKLVFYVLPLDGFDLSDELYIKMNARGKQLTDFENFKADLLNWLQAKDNPQRASLQGEVWLDGRLMNYPLALATKLDNAWTDPFWQYAKPKTGAEVGPFDAAYLRFWGRLLLHDFMLENPSWTIEQNPIYQQLIDGADNSPVARYKGFGVYRTVLEAAPRIPKAERVLNQLATHYAAICAAIAPGWTQNAWHLFDEKMGQRQRVIFFAVTQYLAQHDFQAAQFRQWLKVIWNLAIDPDVRSFAAMVSLMRVVETFATAAGDIHAYLLTDAGLEAIEAESGFVREQLREERAKAALVAADAAWEPALAAAERYELFQGCIGFLLHSKPNIEEFQQRTALAGYLFDTKRGPARQHPLLRAAISAIPTWAALSGFIMEDATGNWQLLLRRNAVVRALIGQLAALPDEAAADAALDNLLTRPSELSTVAADDFATAAARRVHEQLYQNKVLGIWMQQHDAFKLKWHSQQLYVCRPGSWYDWISLDSYRNFLISELCEQMDFAGHNHRAAPMLYWGKWDISLTLQQKSKPPVEAQFSRDGTFLLRLQLPTEMPDDWGLTARYDYAAIPSEAAARALLTAIGNQLKELPDASPVAE